jgi:hypothetical protein
MVVVVLVRQWASTEAATSERSASRETPTAVTAPESAAVACDGEATAVLSFHRGPSRTVSQRDHQEGGAEQAW